MFAPNSSISDIAIVRSVLSKHIFSFYLFFGFPCAFFSNDTVPFFLGCTFLGFVGFLSLFKTGAGFFASAASRSVFFPITMCSCQVGL